MSGLSETEVLSACRILFDLDGRIDRRFLDYVRPSGLKRAYRKKVLETHPDRVATLNRLHQERYTRDFIAVKQAYEKLSAYLKEALRVRVWVILYLLEHARKDFQPKVLFVS